MARHPKRDQLARWLEGTEHDPELDEHLETCEICASDLDTISLSVSNDNPEPSDLGPALLTLLQPPEGLHERMSERLARRLQRRQDLELMGSMLGVARETGEIFMVAPDQSDEGASDVEPETPDSDDDHT